MFIRTKFDAGNLLFCNVIDKEKAYVIKLLSGEL